MSACLRVLTTLSALLLAAPVSAGAVSLQNGDIVLLDPVAFGGAGAVFQVDPITGSQTVIATGGLLSFQSQDVTIRANGEILVTSGAAVIRIDPLTGDQTPVSAGQHLALPFGITLEATGDILVADIEAFGGGGGIIRIDPETGSQTVISSAGNFVNAIDVAIDANGDFIVSDEAFASNGGVFRVDPLTGNQTLISSGGSISGPHGLAIDGAGDILLTSVGNDSIVRVDPITGDQTVVSSGGFLYPTAIAIDDSGDLLVAEGPLSRIVRVDPVTGDQSIVSQDGSFESPAGIVIFGPPECSDGIDNDGDGLSDWNGAGMGAADPGCLDAGSLSESPECNDGDDNDGDGLIDFDGGAGASQSGSLCAGAGLPFECCTGSAMGCQGAADAECVGVGSGTETVCGNGLVELIEECDDGDLDPGDGCSEECTLEVGWSCSGSAPSICTGICGDGLIVGAEECDDGNTADLDCCSSTCAFQEADPGGLFGGTPNCCDAGVCQVGQACGQVCFLNGECAILGDGACRCVGVNP